MNTKTKLLISGFIALSLVLSIVALNRAPTVITQPDGTKTLGVSSDVQTNWFSIGGVKGWYKALPALSTASSTVCALQSPNATSTLVSGGVRFTLASTSAVNVELAKNTTQYSTTTKIGSTYGIAASKQASIVASSTGSVAGDATIFAPNDWFVIRMGDTTSYGSSGAGNVPTGSCFAKWVQI